MKLGGDLEGWAFLIVAGTIAYMADFLDFRKKMNDLFSDIKQDYVDPPCVKVPAREICPADRRMDLGVTLEDDGYVYRHCCYP